MSVLFEPDDEIDHIAEFADSGVRIFQRRGSLVGVPGSYGLKRWLAQQRQRDLHVHRLAPRDRAERNLGVHRQAAAGLPQPGGHRVPDLRDADGRGRDPEEHDRRAHRGHPRRRVSGITVGRVCAIALAVALTGGVLRVLRAAHPPAGATTIIVASGLLHTPRQMLDVLIGVVLLTIAGWCLNRAMGVPAPAWAAPR